MISWNQLNWFVIMEQTFQTWIAAKSLMESKLWDTHLWYALINGKLNDSHIIWNTSISWRKLRFPQSKNCFFTKLNLRHTVILLELVKNCSKFLPKSDCWTCSQRYSWSRGTENRSTCFEATWRFSWNLKFFVSFVLKSCLYLCHPMLRELRECYKNK